MEVVDMKKSIKSLLDLINGSIKIESEEGKGTKVIINLKQKVGS